MVVGMDFGLGSFGGRHRDHRCLEKVPVRTVGAARHRVGAGDAADRPQDQASPASPRVGEPQNPETLATSSLGGATLKPRAAFPNFIFAPQSAKLRPCLP